MSELKKDQFNSRREVHIPITLKGLYNGYQKIFFDAPMDAYEWTVRKSEEISKKGMSGVAAAVTLPLAIMVRNGATVAHNTVYDKGRKLSFFGGLGSVAGACAAWWVAGNFVFAKLAGSAVATIGGKIGAAIVAGALTTPVIAPALAVGMIVTATALGSCAFALSAVPAVVNLKVGLLRTWDRIRGVKYDAATMKALHEKLSEDSISTRHEEKRNHDAIYHVTYRLPETEQEKVYESLKAKFAAAQEKKDKATAAAVSVKAQTPGGPSV